MTNVKILLHSIEGETVFLLCRLGDLLQAVLCTNGARLTIAKHLRSSQHRLVITTQAGMNASTAIGADVNRNGRLLTFRRRTRLKIRSAPLRGALILLPFLLHRQFIPVLPAISVYHCLLRILKSILICLRLLIRIRIK